MSLSTALVVSRALQPLLASLQQELPVVSLARSLPVSSSAIQTRGVLISLPGPFELTKSTAQMATQMAKDSASGKAGTAGRSYQNKGTIATAREILKTRGRWGLYTGLHYHICKSSESMQSAVTSYADRSRIVRDTIGSAIFFPTYESTKQLLVKYQGKSSPTSPSAVAVAGGLCGVVSWIIVSGFLLLSINLEIEHELRLHSRHIRSIQPKPTSRRTVS